VEWIDIEKVTRSQSFRVPDADRLKALIKKLENQNQDKTSLCNGRHVGLSPFEEGE
jgi:hypothetical protein